MKTSTDPDKISMGQSIGFFAISILINALGNGLTISLNLGSALWTASAVNLVTILPISLANMLIIVGLAGIVINALMLQHLDWHKIVGNLIFMFFFGYLVQFATNLLLQLGITQLPLWARVLLDFAGVTLIGIAISIYQRVNLILHPLDETMQIARFKFFHGHSTVAQIVTFIPPIITITIIGLIRHRIEAVNVGTIFALVFEGAIIGRADLIIFPKLKHQRLPKFTTKSPK